MGFVVVIAAATLWPMPGAPQPAEGLCVICGSLGGIDFLSNIALFVPLGVSLVAAGTRPTTTVILGAAFSLGIEALQWQTIAGRDASLGDLFSNTLGTALGAALMSYRRLLLLPSPRVARRLARGMTVLVIVVGSASAWAMRPAPVVYKYWSQWAPVRHNYHPFQGRLLTLVLDNHPIPLGAEIDPTREDSSFAQGLFEVKAVILPDSMPVGTGLIARAGNPIDEEFELAQRGHDLLFRARRNASRLAIRTPVIVLRNAFVGPPGVVYHVSARTRRAHIDLSSTVDGGATVADSVPLTIGRIWQSLAPIEVRDVRWHGPGATAAMALLLLPLAYWAASGVMLSAATVWLGTVALVLIGGIPVVAGIAPGGAWESLGLVLGATVGIALARFTVARTSASGGRPMRSANPLH